MEITPGKTDGETSQGDTEDTEDTTATDTETEESSSKPEYMCFKYHVVQGSRNFAWGCKLLCVLLTDCLTRHSRHAVGLL